MIRKIVNILDKLHASCLDLVKFIIKLVFWVAILFFVLPFLAKLFTSFFGINIQLSDFILLITAAFIIAYTYETQKMKEQIKKQTEIQEKPVLNLYLRESRRGQNTLYALRLKNVGNGPAYNIKFFGIDADDYKYYPHFNEPNPILEKNGDEKDIDLWVQTPDGGVEMYDSTLGFEWFLMRIFNPTVIKERGYDDVARSASVFLIAYEGVSGNKYYSIFRVYSKIVPLLRVYDLVVEFISNGQGVYNLATAKRLCEKRPIMKKNV